MIALVTKDSSAASRNSLAKASKKRLALRITEPQVLKKGSWLTPGETVEPGYLRIMMRKPADYWQKDAPSKLEALASWITDVEHGAGKQLARVIVNRLWHHHFGRGIVATPNDFGELGARPSHPKLLNWLAEELIKNGWHLKHIHRLILTSTTYRQGAATDPAALALDADNQWLWQRRPLRLEAEIIRDRLLSVAGVLKPKMSQTTVFTIPANVLTSGMFRIKANHPKLKNDDSVGGDTRAPIYKDVYREMVTYMYG